MRNNYFDVLKAVAIIAVVLYHFGMCEYGYLGVDIFLVIAGYFTSKSIENYIVSKDRWSTFMANRLFRMWPLLMIAGTICLIYGWFMMLPDDYENVSQSVVATNFFGNNILSAITTKNYWDVNNEYKPLMHTWYVGLIMQYYIIVSLLLFAVSKCFRNTVKRKYVNIVLVTIIGFVSLVMYFFEDNTAYKFYYLFYRLYEFCVGSLIFYLFGQKPKEMKTNVWATIAFVIAYIGIISLLFVDKEYMNRSAKLLMIVGFTSVLMLLMPRVKLAHGNLFSNRRIAIIGEASFSIFVWHQVVIALTRYSFTSNLNEIIPFVVIVLLVAILSFFSFRYVEKMKKTKHAWVLIGMLLLLTTFFSLHIYKIAGVVRDVPELEVMKGRVHRGMWATYCDRGYKYDKEFSDLRNPKWYVIGNSFGRDMVNIILESSIADSVDVIYSTMEDYKKHELRFAQADVVFLSTLGLSDELVEDIKSRCSIDTKFYIIGEKNFGENNGQIYRHRQAKDYHNLTIEMEEGYAEKNEKFKAAYSGFFIDMIEMVSQPDGKVKVFTDEGLFISQDCRHLTKAGAQYYASHMDWERFLNKR